MSFYEDGTGRRSSCFYQIEVVGKRKNDEVEEGLEEGVRDGVKGTIEECTGVSCAKRRG